MGSRMIGLTKIGVKTKPYTHGNSMTVTLKKSFKSIEVPGRATSVSVPEPGGQAGDDEGVGHE